MRHVLVELQARIKASIDGQPLRDMDGQELRGEFVNKLRVKKELRQSVATSQQNLKNQMFKAINDIYTNASTKESQKNRYDKHQR